MEQVFAELVPFTGPCVLVLESFPGRATHLGEVSLALTNKIPLSPSSSLPSSPPLLSIPSVSQSVSLCSLLSSFFISFSLFTFITLKLHLYILQPFSSTPLV